MTQSNRQSELFAGNDWTAIYKAFTSVNLNAFDFDTIRDSMVSYINLNYPEKFNDWVVQSEFVALIDLISYLGQSLAFRMDISSRENFMSMARKRESILRLAQFLSYNPRRNISASGILKLTAVSTTENVLDNSGNNLNNTKITWADPSNDLWYDQFISVLNASFVSTNPFGVYLDQQDIDGVTSQVYRFDSVYNNSGQYSFTSTVNNTSTNFEIVNSQIESKLGYVEIEPNPITKFQLLYLNDGNGNTSNQTGFFSVFKQGIMNYSDYSFPNPIANNSLTIDTSNINDSDVWVQTVNESGYVTTDGLWTKVGYVPTDDITKIITDSENITYNSSLSDTQRIFQALTLSDDQVMIKFGDGNFGQIPTGMIRVWYRVSNGQSYYIQPDEIQDIPISVNYYDSTGKVQTITLYYSLFDTIVNASQTQSNDDIKRIASNVYSTQGRMVSGSDYNYLPESIGSGLKIKAINRFYSGQSRFIDINDPTGQYQNTTTFSDDGAIYSQYVLNYTGINSTTLTASEIIYNYVISLFQLNGLTNFMLNEWLTNTSYPFNYTSTSVIWKRSTQTNYTSTGLFTDTSGNIIPVGNTVINKVPVRYIESGSYLKFKDPSGNIIWVSVESLNENGTIWYSNSGEGPVKLNNIIPDGSTLITVIPKYDDDLSTGDVSNLSVQIGKNMTFAVGYDYDTNELYYIDGSNIDYVSDYTFSTKGTSADSSWIMRFEYTPIGWKIFTRTLDFIFESANNVKFFFIDDTSVINPRTGLTDVDTISFLKYNLYGLKNDIVYDINSSYVYPDGFTEPRRVKLGYQTTGTDGAINDPSSFITALTFGSNYVFHKKTQDSNGYEVWILTSDVTILPDASGKVTFDTNTKSFSTTDTTNYPITNYTWNHGNSNIAFKWHHVAPLNHRIDPAVSNIIDIFVLTSGFNEEMISWRENGYSTSDIPVAPTEVDLSLEFNEMESYKMFSDEIIWRPANFKLIGGKTADATLQFDMMVVPLPGTPYSDGEIKTSVLSVINDYFDVSSWDFGETFYASELIGYLHQQLLNSISSVVLVPNGSNQSFGNLFEIQANENELFFPTLTVDNIKIVTTLTNTNLRIQ